MLNHLSPFHAKGPQRRERLLNLATLRRPAAEAEPSEPAASTAPTEEAHAGTHPADAACPE
jgi:hypothetical protein